MVGRKDLGLALLHIFVPVDNLDRDKEYPAGEAAPEDGRYVVTVLHFDVASERLMKTAAPPASRIAAHQAKST